MEEDARRDLALCTPWPSNVRGDDAANAEQETETEAFVRHYLNLEPDLTTLYQQWSRADANFRKKAPRFCGVRNLRQDAWETLVGFICSSNNNIVRISQMVGYARHHLLAQAKFQMDKLCLHYGVCIGDVDGIPYHDMPGPQALIDGTVEPHLRHLGFGYRAKYLHQTAVMVWGKERSDWLDSLRNPESPILGHTRGDAGPMRPEGRPGYRAAHTELLTLQGVGPKVADCVCLMGLGWGESVPIDTHLWQIAQRDYKFGRGKHISLTRAIYDAIGDKFRSLWGKEAGWAHTVLFTADLRAFSDRVAMKLELDSESDDKQGVKIESDILVKHEDLSIKAIKVKDEDLSIAGIKVKDEDDQISQDTLLKTGEWAGEKKNPTRRRSRRSEGLVQTKATKKRRTT